MDCLQDPPVISLLRLLSAFSLMVCVGYELSLGQFRALLRRPRALWVGLGCQQLLSPLCGLLIGWAYRDAPEIAVGLMLLVASPSGTVANAIVYLGRGRLDLSVALSGLNGVLCIVFTPAVVALALSLFASESLVAALDPVQAMVRVVAVVLMPVALGMALRRRWCSARLSRCVRRVAMVLLLGLVVLVLLSNGCGAPPPRSAVTAAALLSAAMMIASYALSWLCRLEARDRFTIAIEASVHNIPMAVMLAFEVLDQPLLAHVAIGYLPVVALLTIGWAAWRRLRLPCAEGGPLEA